MKDFGRFFGGIRKAMKRNEQQKKLAHDHDIRKPQNLQYMHTFSQSQSQVLLGYIFIKTFLSSLLSFFFFIVNRFFLLTIYSLYVIYILGFWLFYL